MTTMTTRTAGTTTTRRPNRAVLAAAALLAGACALAPSDALACGGCFQPPVPMQQATQVTGHRMILALSQKQTTLYDQIQYAGSPSSFAWVLPIKGTVTVGLSSDLLFATLDSMTQLTVQAPSCPSYLPCNSTGFAASASTSSGSGGGGVEILVQQTVGPYETVQLSSSDPNALSQWLSDHGYAIPVAVQPIVNAYVAEKFNFLAMKLVPGAMVSAMRPVRVTMAGASPGLPLRMVNAGTGNTTLLTLWMVSEGRYQPKSAPWFTIGGDELSWDFVTQSSNYVAVRQQKYDASSGFAWQIERANALSQLALENSITNSVKLAPDKSGYDPQQAVMQANDDLATLFGGIAPNSTWITRMRAELSHAAMQTDLVVEAAPNQLPLPQILVASKNAPQCPPPPDCSGSASVGGTGGADGVAVGSTSATGPSVVNMSGQGGASGDVVVTNGCATRGADGGSTALELIVAFGLVFRARAARRRPRTPRRGGWIPVRGHDAEII